MFEGELEGVGVKDLLTEESRECVKKTGGMCGYRVEWRRRSA